LPVEGLEKGPIPHGAFTWACKAPAQANTTSIRKRFSFIPNTFVSIANP